MKIRIMSDLHLEGRFLNTSPMGEDVVVLAGDIGKHTQGVEWAHRTFIQNWPAEKRPHVIYVPGNHEFYGSHWFGMIKQIHDMGTKLGVIVLDPNHTVSATVSALDDMNDRMVFTGGTMWTDFKLFGDERKRRDMAEVESCLYDFKLIRHGDQYLTGRATIAEFNKTVRSIEQTCRNTSADVCVVTHHAPSLRSSAPWFLNDPVTAGFASRLDMFIQENPQIKFWIHGHMHNCSDYMIGNCNVICNPRGYPMGGGREENNAWQHGLIIDTRQPRFAAA